MVPETLDYFHRQYSDNVYDGSLGVEDYVFSSTYLTVLPQGNLYVTSYQDRPELRRRGVGTSFYARLREFAIRAGFRFISGHNHEENEPRSNYTYYTQKLGRKRFELLPNRIRELLAGQGEGEDGVFTVDCLDPKDLIET